MLKSLQLLKIPLLILFFQLMYNSSNAQSLAINATGSAAHASALLDVSSTNKGMLIPRISLTSITDVATIPTPATSLLVYNTNAAISGGSGLGYYYFDGTKWVKLMDDNTPKNNWGILGNTDIVDTNFIGTIENVALNFKVNNEKAGRINPNGSTFFGYQAGNVENLNPNSINNTGIGKQALYSDYGGDDNTAIGNHSMFSNTQGVLNTAVGSGSLSSNINGEGNTANGINALFGNTTGGYNTGNGAFSLVGNISGNYNTGNGAFSLAIDSTGSDNTATGFFALYLNSSGNQNVANGDSALLLNTIGNRNTTVGAKSLYSNTTGNNNTALGYSSFYNGTAFSNSTALGANTVITASNQIRAGDASITSIGGQVGWTTISDKRFKTNVKETVPGLSFILMLRPVTYNLNMDAIAKFTHTPDSLRLKDGENAKAKMSQTGFIAQEVEAAAKELGYDFSGVDKPKNENDYYGLRYAEFTVPLVKAVQEQQIIIETQKQNLEIQKKRIDQLEILVKALSEKNK